MTIQPVTITPKENKRFAVYSKFPTWSVCAIDPLHISGDFVAFDLMVYLNVDNIDHEQTALNWMQKGEKHRVKLTFLDDAGKLTASWAFENVIVETIAFEGIAFESNQPLVMRVGCSGKLASLK